MDEQGGDAACWAAQFDDPTATRVTVRSVDDAADSTGRRVLVDAIAPATGAEYELWLPKIAPSPSLMHAFDDRPERWVQFRANYVVALGDAGRAAALATLERLARQERLTLITAAPDPSRSGAEVVRAVLTERLGDQKS
ncbi:MAG TPA: DUF488 family protein [Thermomicrobiales bacterium]|nr:DUF488 family protein [Thermomicrobiales bacterium]